MSNQPTVNGIAAHMWEVLEKASAGDMTPAAANASVAAGGAIVRLFVAQMQYARMRNEVPEIAFFSNPAGQVEAPAQPTQIGKAGRVRGDGCDD